MVHNESKYNRRLAADISLIVALIILLIVIVINTDNITPVAVTDLYKTKSTLEVWDNHKERICDILLYELTSLTPDVFDRGVIHFNQFNDLQELEDDPDLIMVIMNTDNYYSQMIEKSTNTESIEYATSRLNKITNKYNYITMRD